MFYKINHNDLGIYLDSDGNLCEIEEATSVAVPPGVTNVWIEYKNLDEAINGFNLTYKGTNTLSQQLTERIENLEQENQMLTECLLEVSALLYQ